MPKSNSQPKKVHQTHASATSKWGLNGEERAALFRNKGRTEQFQRRANWQWASPDPARGRRQGEGKGANSAQRRHPLPNCKQAPSF